MTKNYYKDITKHEIRIQEFDWMSQRYDCIIGVWCLGYLNQEERENVMTGITTALKNDGYVILFEAVLKEDDTADQRLHNIRKQQLMIRKEEFYTNFFKEHGFKIKY